MRRFVEQQPFAERLARAERDESNGPTVAALLDRDRPGRDDRHELPRRALLEEHLVAFERRDGDELGQLMECGVGEAGEKLGLTEAVAEGGSRHGDETYRTVGQSLSRNGPSRGAGIAVDPGPSLDSDCPTNRWVSSPCLPPRSATDSVRPVSRRPHRLRDPSTGPLVSDATFECDELLFEEGAPRKLMAIIVTGAVAIEKAEAGRPVRLATLGAGQAVGEGLLLDDSTHGTSARALSEPSLRPPRGAGADMMKEHPPLYAALVGRAARAISQRLAAPDATLVGRGRTLGFGGEHDAREHDLLGEREVPDEALYGVQTLRALENFPITGIALREFPSLIEALAAVKEAAALRERRARVCSSRSIADVDRARRAARFAPDGITSTFVVDMIQGGAGTSTNMNANEVIANRALELLGQPARRLRRSCTRTTTSTSASPRTTSIRRR